MGIAGGRFVPVDGGGFAYAASGAGAWVPEPAATDGARPDRRTGAEGRRPGTAGFPPDAGPGGPAGSRLFIRNLPFAASEAEVQEHLERGAGARAASVVLLRQADGRSRGLAKVITHGQFMNEHPMP